MNCHRHPTRRAAIIWQRDVIRPLPLCWPCAYERLNKELNNEHTQRIRNQMWTKEELYAEMQRLGWEPGTVDGLFVHRKSGKSLDMMSRNRHGALWIQYATANVTPSPF